MRPGVSRSVGVRRLPDDADDPGPGGAGELNGEVARAARGPGDQHGAPQEQAALFEGVEGGQPRDRQRRRLGEGDAVGQRRHRVGRHGDQFGPRAGWQEPDHSRALLRAGAIRCGLFDRPGDIPAGACARRRVHRAVDLSPVEGDRRHANQGFILGRDRRVDRADYQATRCLRIDEHCFDLTHLMVSCSVVRS